VTSRRCAAAALTSLALAASVLACGGASTRPPGPSAVLTGAAAAMSTLATAGVDIGFGAGLSIDELTLFAGTAVVALPDASDATFRVRRGGFLVDLRVIGAGGHRYARVPPAPFQELSADAAAEIPDPEGLLDARRGLPALLPAGRRPAYLGMETVDGVASDEVSAGYAADQLQPLIRAQPAGAGTVTIWAGRADHRVRRAVLAGPLREAGRRFQVELHFHDFDRPATVTAPPLPTTTSG
jgi:hypothetical protein